jgi:hypothetical protein
MGGSRRRGKNLTGSRDAEAPPRAATSPEQMEDVGRERQYPGLKNEGVGEHVRTRFHAGLLGPVKLRVVKDTRTERRKTCFFCRTVFERAGFF